MSQDSNLRIGWAAADLTPDRPVLVCGQFHARVSEGVNDPITATALALDSGEARAVMVSCDLVSIPDNLRLAVREHVRDLLPELDPALVFLNATHTHTGPEVRVQSDTQRTGGSNVPTRLGVELDVTDPADTVAVASRRIAEAVAQAWQSRRPGGIGFGLAHATVGYNRRMSYYTGETRMYGNPNDPAFSHIEGGTDSSVNVLCTWDPDRRLTGLVVNLACPSQVSEGDFRLSADYWCETRRELRRRLGEGLFILPQNSPSGDQSPAKPSILIGWRAQERMWRLMGRTQREDIGVRIADAVTGILPYVEGEIDWSPCLAHRVETVELLRRKLTRRDVDEAQAEAAALREQYEAMRRDLEAHPEKRERPRWYVDITSVYRRMQWNEGVAARFEMQQANPRMPVELHVLRLGDVAMATNPFEYYLDYALQIKARSKAVQTFLVQHVGTGAYLPTERAVAGRSYGAVPASTPVGPEGGRELANWTVDAVNALWDAVE